MGSASLMLGPMRWARRHGMPSRGGRIGILAVVACKNAEYPRQWPWAVVSAWFDEAPTGQVFGSERRMFMVEARGYAGRARRSQ